MGINYREQVRAALAGGPVLKWPLLRTKRAAFRMAYRSMILSTEIVESGSGAMGNPVYVGLAGVEFPAPKAKVIRIRKADVELMQRAGHTGAEARAILEPLVNDLPAYLAALARAEEDAARIANDQDAERWGSQVNGAR